MEDRLPVRDTPGVAILDSPPREGRSLILTALKILLLTAGLALTNGQVVPRIQQLLAKGLYLPLSIILAI